MIKSDSWSSSVSTNDSLDVFNYTKDFRVSTGGEIDTQRVDLNRCDSDFIREEVDLAGAYNIEGGFSISVFDKK